MMRSALVLSVVCVHTFVNAAPCTAQGSAAETAYVESVTGRAIAMVQGKPVLLDLLDTITDRTRVDLLANSELRICHYHRQRIMTLAGPLRVSVTSAGVTAENGKAIAASGETCLKPVVSSFQGGFVARTAKTQSAKAPLANVANVALQPNIKLVNRGSNGITGATLWDQSQQTIVSTFRQNAARPTLDEGQVYHLVVGRSDGSESRMTLRASAAASRSPRFLVVP
jgi:hypothetical protein